MFNYKDYFNHATQLIFIIDHNGAVLEVNHAGANLTGIAHKQIVNQIFWELPCWLHSKEMQNMVVFSMEQSAITMESVRFAAQYKDKDNAIVDLDLVIKPVFNESDDVAYFVAMGYNITELVSARKALSESERQMKALFENSSEGYFFNVLPEPIKTDVANQAFIVEDLFNYQRITRYNKALCNILGYKENTSFKIDYAQKLLSLSKTQYLEMLNKMVQNGSAHLEYSFINQHQQRKVIEILFVTIETEGSLYGNYCIVKDLTIQRQYEAELSFYAFNDSLTGLSNRRTFLKIVEDYLKNNQGTVIAMLDIDHFKSINDTYGHDVGDDVLKAFSSAMANHFSADGIVARLGGEEFAIFFESTPCEVAERSLNNFREAFAKMQHNPTEDKTFNVTVSIGYTKITPNDNNIKNLLKKADIALYQAKSSGRNRVIACKKELESTLSKIQRGHYEQ